MHDIERELSGKGFSGDLRTDLATRLLYSTDASIYQIEPLGVAFPRRADELATIMELCAAYGVPVLARGAGSSLAGQAIGRALIMDCSRHLNQLIEIDPERQTATVEPGLLLPALNREAAKYGLQFGPDPASAERSTLGGSIANNASGAHSILYGMAADHILSAEVVLSDGSEATFGEMSGFSNHSSRFNEFCRTVLHIREQYTGAIQQDWPRTWRRASGYALNYLIPWSPSQPPQWSEAMQGKRDGGDLSLMNYPPISPDTVNLAPLLAGSEGTLAIIRRATVRLVPAPHHTVLGVLQFDDIASACDAVPSILAQGPSAVELIPRSLLHLARSVPAYAHQLSFVQGDPAALLVVEFAGDDPSLLKRQAKGLGEQVLLAESAKEQSQVWGIRKVGLGIMQSRPGDRKPVAFIEDLAVPVERLGEFVREMERILAAHASEAEIYAHASAGCLHIRPLLNLKTVQGISAMRSIASQAVALTIRLGGAVSGEHGDGLARSEWVEQMFGSEIVQAFRELKRAADPQNLLNPGKIVVASEAGEIPREIPRMDTNLRFGPEYQVRDWQTRLDFSRQAGFAGAVELCNGAGVCRKEDGVMCPSFQATQDEMHSTRGRANLLRAMLSGHFPTDRLAEKTVYQALDLCLACKGCKAECPSAVDMAKLKYEFMDRYYRHNRRNVMDYLFGYIGSLAWMGHRLAFLINPTLQHPVAGKLAESLVGLSRRRKLPVLSSRSLRSQARRLQPVSKNSPDQVLFLTDAFTEYFYPQAGMAALRVLHAAGCSVQILPVIGAGRTLISKGFLEPARRHARRLLESLMRLDPDGKIPVVGIEPSEIYTLRDEFLDLLPGEDSVEKLAGRAFMIDEFLIRPGAGSHPRIASLMEKNVTKENKRRKVALHGHCYQKAQPPKADGYPIGVQATVAMLEAVGYQVKLIESGCCGMAGAFGYEAEHYDLSMQVGELKLFPAVRGLEEGVILAAAGVSCQAQIEDGTQRSAVHPITLV